MKPLSKQSKLALLQLEQYDTTRYLHKLKVTRNLDLVKRLRWTKRLVLTNSLSTILGIVIANELIGLPLRMVEKVVWYWVQYRLTKLRKLGLKVVAIAGSYGKTSVKHYAYEVLRNNFRVVATPESYNTVLGIAKTVYWEVDQQTEIFLVEVGAYHLGDITYLLQMTQPEVGVLTGIARQHLERFGSWENIISAKTEIALYMKSVRGILVANRADETVAAAINAIGGDVKWYGKGKDRNEINLDGGKVTAIALGMNPELVSSTSKRVRPVPHRFEMTIERYGMRVIDDAFSSNEKGFTDAVKQLGKEKKYTRILVTPGLVELGKESDRIHHELGQVVANNVDYLILVGQNERTAAIEAAINDRVPVIKIVKTLDFVKAVKALKLKKEPLILIENDVTENYG